MTNDLKREVLELLDLVHELIRTDEDHNEPTQRLVLNLPEGWHVFAAWLEMREQMRRTGKHGPSPLPVQALNRRAIRGLAKTHIDWVLNEHFHLELHDLAMGGHRLLKPPVVTVANSNKGGAS